MIQKNSSSTNVPILIFTTLKSSQSMIRAGSLAANQQPLLAAHKLNPRKLCANSSEQPNSSAFTKKTDIPPTSTYCAKHWWRKRTRISTSRIWMTTDTNPGSKPSPNPTKHMKCSKYSSKPHGMYSNLCTKKKRYSFRSNLFHMYHCGSWGSLKKNRTRGLKMNISQLTSMTNPHSLCRIHSSMILNSDLDNQRPRTKNTCRWILTRHAYQSSKESSIWLGLGIQGLSNRISIGWVCSIRLNKNGPDAHCTWWKMAKECPSLKRI